jgi:hypothetical protein
MNIKKYVPIINRIVTGIRAGNSGRFTTYSINRLWNLASLPVTVPDAHAASVFPGASSKTCQSRGTYQPQDFLNNGKGYWIRYSSGRLLRRILFSPLPHHSPAGSRINRLSPPKGCHHTRNNRGLLLRAGHGNLFSFFPFFGTLKDLYAFFI